MHSLRQATQVQQWRKYSVTRQKSTVDASGLGPSGSIWLKRASLRQST